MFLLRSGRLSVHNLQSNRFLRRTDAIASSGGDEPSNAHRDHAFGTDILGMDLPMSFFRTFETAGDPTLHRAARAVRLQQLQHQQQLLKDRAKDAVRGEVR